MWCGEQGEEVPVYRTPTIFQIPDLTRSYKTGATLPKRGKFKKFKAYPSSLSELLKLYYSNGVQRMLPDKNSLLGKFRRM
jgi:hypothetical protein